MEVLGRRNPSADMVTGSVMNAVATTTMVLGNIYTLEKYSGGAGLGLSPEYDTTNKVLVYERLRRFFIHNPSITVYFMPVDQAVTLTQMADKDNNYLAKLLRDKSGENRSGEFIQKPKGGLCTNYWNRTG